MKLYHIGLCATSGTNNGLQKAFKKHCEYYEVHTGHKNLNAQIVSDCERIKPDIVFMQIQTPNVVLIDTINKIRPHVGKIINFTGDVRSPLPEWYIETGKLIDLTLFVSNTDVKLAREKGIKADWIQIGFDPEIFNLTASKKSVDVTFSANNYTQFPLSKYRYDIVHALKNRSGFALFGSGWKPVIAGDTNYSLEAQSVILNNSKIAISCSNFNHSKYISDRTLRIMGAGTFCLHHHFEDCEELYKDKEHLVYFRSIPEMIDLIDYYLEHEEERERIAKNGYELTHQLYTWDSFVKNICAL